MNVKPQKNRTLTLTLTALATAVLAGCGSSDSGSTNDLPQGITQRGVTVYPATAVGSGSTAATQDLLTAGIGRTGLGAAAAPAASNAGAINNTLARRVSSGPTVLFRHDHHGHDPAVVGVKVSRQAFRLSVRRHVFKGHPIGGHSRPPCLLRAHFHTSRRSVRPAR